MITSGVRPHSSSGVSRKREAIASNQASEHLQNHDQQYRKCKLGAQANQATRLSHPPFQTLAFICSGAEIRGGENQPALPSSLNVRLRQNNARSQIA